MALIRYYSPDCDYLEEQLGNMLCESPNAGETEDVGYEDLVIG